MTESSTERGGGTLIHRVFPGPSNEGASLGHVDAARRAFVAAIEANPKDPTPCVNLGSLKLLNAANPAAAVQYVTEALALDPGSSRLSPGSSDPGNAAIMSHAGSEDPASTDSGSRPPRESRRV